jgi:hypothetical protein
MPTGMPRQLSSACGLAVAALCGCSRVDRAAETEQQPPSIPEDSLVLSGQNGVQVWFTLARAAQSAAGASCTERGLEIRRDGKRIPVPLLYTGDAPTLLNDSTIRAFLWTNCRPVQAYLVDVRSGQPVPERARSKVR